LLRNIGKITDYMVSHHRRNYFSVSALIDYRSKSDITNAQAKIKNVFFESIDKVE
jgi:type III secretory pathway lipoprotein EscJ